MDKQPPGWREKAKKCLDEKTTTVFQVALLVLLLLSVFLLPLVMVLSLWVMFDCTIGCDAYWIYEGLGVTEKAAAIKTLGFITAGIVVFGGWRRPTGDLMPWTNRPRPPPNRPRPPPNRPRPLPNRPRSRRRSQGHRRWKPPTGFQGWGGASG